MKMPIVRLMICRLTFDFFNTYNDSYLSLHNDTDTVLNLIRHPLHLLPFTSFTPSSTTPTPPPSPSNGPPSAPDTIAPLCDERICGVSLGRASGGCLWEEPL